MSSSISVEYAYAVRTTKEGKTKRDMNLSPIGSHFSCIIIRAGLKGERINKNVVTSDGDFLYEL